MGVKMDYRELKMLQALPLNIKVAKSKLRIREAIDYFGVDGVYIPVSGGLDSMVLSYIVEEYQREYGIEKSRIPRVNSNTGVEFPSVLKRARELSDIEVRPSMTPYEVWTKIGYPIGSKKVSRMIRDIQNPTEKNINTRNLYLTGIKRDGSKGSSRCKLSKEYYPFIDGTIKVKVSEKCCDIVKKEPLHRFEKETGRIPLLGTMASEGGTRSDGYLKTGCNAFHIGKSMPIGFWTKQDILQFIVINNIKIAEEYGEIKVDEAGDLYTTGEERTGCFTCPFGVKFDKGENRFQRMKRIHPKMWEFVIKGGHIDTDGYYKPKNGLGIGRLLDLIGIEYDDYKTEKEKEQIDGQINIFELVD